MAEQGPKRKLAAILSADVAGYSRLMADDEAATVETLTRYRQVFADLVQRHDGRVVDSPGDNILAEFASVVEAVACANEVQRELARRNRQLAEHRRMEFRIGVHLGDVISKDDGTIYGDGVNIAARLESLAEPGEVMISEDAHRQVRTKLDLGFADAGEHEVKNISEPVRAYRVRIVPGAAPKVSRPKRRQLQRAGLAAGVVVLIVGGGLVVWQLYPRPAPPPTELALGEAPALELPDKPSIAVLPFVNISGDPEQERFVDGITDNIITELSRFRNLFVIASNSVFTYKGKAVKVQQVARELGVKYVLEGGVQREGERLRITAQLVDATTGYHVWAESYDRDVKDLFAVQDEVTQEIVVTVGSGMGQLARAEFERAKRKPTESLEAYDYFLLGLEHQKRHTKEDNAISLDLFEKAIELDPEFAQAYALAAWSHMNDWLFEWSDSPADSAELALESAQKAVALAPYDARTHFALGGMHAWMTHELEKGLAEYEKALELNPNYADVLMDFGAILVLAGRPEEGIEAVHKAMRLNPRYPDWYEWAAGIAAYAARRYEEAVAALQRFQNHNVESRSYLAASYAQLGRIEEAQPEVEKILELDPEFSIADWAEKQAYKNQVDLDHYLDGLRKAGLPE